MVDWYFGGSCPMYCYDIPAPHGSKISSVAQHCPHQFVGILLVNSLAISRVTGTHTICTQLLVKEIDCQN